VNAAVLEARSLRKEYPGTLALDDVSARFEGGSIHALIGKNGAGKSTFVRILAGAVRPTAGELLLNGRPISCASPREALHQGIATVHQELSLVPELTVAENIMLGRLPTRPGTGGMLVNWKATHARAEQVLSALNVVLDVRRPARALGVAHQQIVEIARAMSYSPKVLLLDEPTSALAQGEAERLFSLLRDLASRGVIILYITHRLQEIPAIADTVTVLRNGRHAGTIPVREATPEQMARMMFGDVVRSHRPADITPGGELLLEVRGLTSPGKFSDVSFSVRAGEIVGIAGLLGSGRTELLRSIAGADPPVGGDVVLRGRRVRPDSPARMKSLGVVLAPENRKDEGLIQILSSRENLVLPALRRITRAGTTTRARERAAVAPLVRSLGIHMPDVDAPVSVLSGGNQQKIVLGKWLLAGASVILLDEPTRGIDVQAKQQVFDIVWSLSRQGIATLVVSSELEELPDLCHRILVMRHGAITGEVRAADITVDQLLARCLA
jgi:ABC-type sugar transport system ATPase subunit